MMALAEHNALVARRGEMDEVPGEQITAYLEQFDW